MRSQLANGGSLPVRDMLHIAVRNRALESSFRLRALARQVSLGQLPLEFGDALLARRARER